MTSQLHEPHKYIQMVLEKLDTIDDDVIKRICSIYYNADQEGSKKIALKMLKNIVGDLTLLIECDKKDQNFMKMQKRDQACLYSQMKVIVNLLILEVPCVLTGTEEFYMLANSILELNCRFLGSDVPTSETILQSFGFIYGFLISIINGNNIEKVKTMLKKVGLDAICNLVEDKLDVHMKLIYWKQFVSPFLAFVQKQDDFSYDMHLDDILKQIFIKALNSRTDYLYPIFCCCINHMIPRLAKSDFLLEMNVFIEKGLVHESQFIKKEAVYLLELLISHPDTQENKSNGEFWRISCWQMFLDVYKTLHEVQIHLVTPVIPKLMTLLKNSCFDDSSLSLRWILILFQVGFTNHNKKVQQSLLFQFLKFDNFTVSSANQVAQFLIEHLPQMLNNVNFYSLMLEDSTCQSLLGIHLQKFIRTIYTLLEPSLQTIFIKSSLLDLFGKKLQNSVGQFYIIRSLSKLPLSSSLKYCDILEAQLNYIPIRNTQDRGLRTTIQTDFIITFLNHSSGLSAMEICSLVISLEPSSWQGVNKVRQKLLDKFSYNFNFDPNLNNIQQSSTGNSPELRSEAVGLYISLYLQKSIENGDLGTFENKIICPILKVLESCSQRPYLNIYQITWVLELLNNVFNTSSNHTLIALSEHLKTISYEVSQMNSLHIKLLSNNTSESRTLVHTFSTAYIILCSNLKSFGLLHFENLLNPITETDLNFILQDDSPAISVINYLLGILPKDNHYFTPYYLQKLQDLILNIIVKHNVPSAKVSPLDCWSCLIHIDDWGSSKTEAILINLNTILNQCCSQDIEIIFKCLNKILKHHVKYWREVVCLLWQTLAEYRRTPKTYKSLIKLFFKIFFSAEALAYKSNYSFYIELFTKMWITIQEILGLVDCASLALVKALMEPFQLLKNCNQNFIHSIFIPLAISENAGLKQHKFVRDTIQCIKRNWSEEYNSIQEFYSDFESDIISKSNIVIYLASIENTEVANIFAKDFVYATIDSYRKHCSPKFPEHSNSFVHRQKTTLLQMNLVLFDLFNEEGLKALMKLCSTYLEVSQQPSIRYFVEWAMALIILKNPRLIPTFFSTMEQDVDRRSGCTASYVAALTLAASFNEDQEFIGEVIQKIMPLCMAHHYNTRLYAQIGLAKIWQSVAKKFDVLVSRYNVVCKCLLENSKSPGEHSSILNDFFFSSLHPTNDLTLENIFYEIPRLSGMVDDYLISTDCLRTIQEKLHLKSLRVPYKNDKSLRNITAASWVQKIADEPIPEYVLKDQQDYNVQKKITPVNLRNELMSSTNNIERRSKMVLVASLVDKIPNLGGLCRSCEIFNAEEMVISSKSVLRDKSFLALSLNAHQWLPFREVTVSDLPVFFKRMSMDGYTIIGVEQTIESLSLEKYVFPEKSVIVLGHERKGIPCDLLQLMDVCVEIPQSGVVRSLNVHVSGALLLWEYTKQQLTEK